jgi:endogenous inhibitor of DNA gyrase (YacG/DUF329 family)
MATPAVPVMPCRKCGTKLRAGGTARNPAFPFCSERCRDSDLGAWVNEGYSIAAPPTSPEEIDALIDQLEQGQGES